METSLGGSVICFFGRGVWDVGEELGDMEVIECRRCIGVDEMIWGESF